MDVDEEENPTELKSHLSAANSRKTATVSRMQALISNCSKELGILIHIEEEIPEHASVKSLEPNTYRIPFSMFRAMDN